MNTIAIRHPGVTVAYRTSVFNTKRREVMKQIKFFLNKRRFKQHVRCMFTSSHSLSLIKEMSNTRRLMAS